MWCPSLWSTVPASIETVVSGCSSALFEWNQPVITENMQQVWAAWAMKCTNYCLRVLEKCTQEPKQHGGEQRGGLKAAPACSVKIKMILTPVLPVPDIYSVDNMWRKMYVDWVMWPVDKIHTSSVIGRSGNCKGAMWLVDEAMGHAVRVRQRSNPWDSDMWTQNSHVHIRPWKWSKETQKKQFEFEGNSLILIESDCLHANHGRFVWPLQGCPIFKPWWLSAGNDESTALVVGLHFKLSYLIYQPSIVIWVFHKRHTLLNVQSLESSLMLKD